MTIILSLVALPFWLLAALLIGCITGIAAIGPLVVRRYVTLERLSTNNEVAGFKFATVGVIYAVLLAFAVIVVWEKFRDAESAVTREAGALVSLHRLSATVDPDLRARLRKEAATYVRVAIAVDWPAMAHGGGSQEVTRALTAVYDAVLAFEPGRPGSDVVMAEMLDQLDLVTQARRERLDLATGIVPGVVWLVLFGGATLTIAFTFFFGTENLHAQVWMTAVLALMISTSLLVVVVIDHPFTGTVKVSPRPLEAVLEAFVEGESSGSG